MKVDVRNNNVDQALRVLKKKLQLDGLFNEIIDPLIADHQAKLIEANGL